MDGYRSVLFFPRSILITAVILSLAVGAHVLGGGVLPELPVLVALAVFMLLPVASLSRRPLSFSALVGVLGGGQVLLHGAFTAFPGSQRCIPTITTGHSHHVDSIAVHCAAVDTAASAVASMPVMQAGFLSPMTIAHLLAVLMTAWIITRGESALMCLQAWISARVPDTNPGLPVVAKPLRALPAAPVAARPRRNLRPHSQRGPPALSGAARVRLPHLVPA